MSPRNHRELAQAGHRFSRALPSSVEAPVRELFRHAFYSGACIMIKRIFDATDADDDRAADKVMDGLMAEVGEFWASIVDAQETRS